MKVFLTIGLAVLVLAGCGQKFSGTYMADTQKKATMPLMEKLEFVEGGQVDMVPIMGPTVRAGYKVEDKKLVISNAQGSMVFTIDADGCLDSGDYATMGRFCKQK